MIKVHGIVQFHFLLQNLSTFYFGIIVFNSISSACAENMLAIHIIASHQKSFVAFVKPYVHSSHR